MILPFLAIAFLTLATVYSAMVSFRQSEALPPSWIFPTTTNRSVRIVLGITSFALLIALAFWLGLGTRHENQRSSRFLIPDGYTGWIRVEFEVQGAPPLPMESGEYVLRIPATGILQTSSTEQYGWAQDHYYYYSAQGMRALPDFGASSMIWGKLNAEASGTAGKRKYEEFFVGTSQQFKNQSKE
jgi:hypothetical protein